MKELLFTPESLMIHKMHMDSNPDYLRRRVTTSRRREHGIIGEIFKIEGLGGGYFELMSIFEYVGKDNVKIAINEYYEDEGFKSVAAFKNCLKKLYGAVPDALYVHHLREVYILD